MRIDVKSYVRGEKELLKDIIKERRLELSLLILQMGDDPASNSYIRGKIKDGAEIGITVDLFKTSSYDKMFMFLLERGGSYSGVILQEPSNLTDKQRKNILNLIARAQDVDGFKQDSFHPQCTPAAIMDLIKHFYVGELRGKTVVVIGRGELVGKPLVPMLMAEGATVINCNSKTQPLKDYVKMGDIVVAATGVCNLVTRDMLKDGALVIDAGIAFDEEGRICGDCDKALYDDENVLITTVPGGVGLATRLQLMKNIVSNRLPC